ncbi:ABC transporter ATP-binding protein [Aliihoeflea sp. 40Bstr573]|uniref:ABC transporter ATP-binding protein n=1 Tax=Aliihoeflea sp. 40Bstr573 TaxID=2696467 RepID=UPI0020959C96|nr:ATP-binding cassette domain-containing protein [Aliihoeflea sp. 40Bstr573]MCO6388392.1 ATP-binding cassette domain-containing protein [Aliihoeflea sp. 40Bstr573]
MSAAFSVPEAAPAVAWREVAVRYPYAANLAVGPVSLELRKGERLLLLGPSGCGKSTLLGTITGLVPATIPAEITGEIATLGVPAASRSPAEWSASVAQLFQDADQTLCGMTVGDEVAFALENRALPADEIATRVDRALAKAGVPESWRARRTAALSGGERQLVALAAALAQEAALFIADEPTAHLSPDAAARLHAVIGGEGETFLVVDHRLDGLIGTIDRVAVIGRNGALFAEGSPRDIFRARGEVLAAEGIWRPLAADLDRLLCGIGIVLERPPLVLSEIIDGLNRLSPADRTAAGTVIRHFLSDRIAGPTASTRPSCATLVHAACAPLFAKPVLHDISMEIGPGETVAILGRNGAGKSTLGATLAGLLRLKGGTRTGPAGGFAFQRPETQFTEGSVRAELESIVGKDAASIDAILSAWRLENVADQHPFELSQGQKRRLALATLTADTRWPFLVLDEPTAGLDAAASNEIASRIAKIAADGRAVMVITHDMDFALKTCSRGIVLDGGSIAADAPLIDLLRDGELLASAGLNAPELLLLVDWMEAVPC